MSKGTLSSLHPVTSSCERTTSTLFIFSQNCFVVDPRDGIEMVSKEKEQDTLDRHLMDKPNKNGFSDFVASEAFFIYINNLYTVW